MGDSWVIPSVTSLTERSVCSEVALGEIGVSRHCPFVSKLLKTFLKSHTCFFIMEKWPVSEEFYVKVESLKFQPFFYRVKSDFFFQSFNFDLK